ncbi:MAG: imidazole glycerol phosphate synthase subunit HisF [Bacteroidetes bacterium]|nr:MAG: imidazole glycerol phosphate synthase subunit HisF [Bacteroidota bacterium]TAG89319.1 MAG: imidazole glycerol phosphate synthase subunit HisF [Bacteroidota bacterium]
MLAKRIIPCLDIKDGQTVKGINFENLKNAGNPVELAQKYVQEGADELVFLDITATIENRNTLISLVKKVAATINIPFTVGGGIKNADDVARLLEAGADKISINSSAVQNPNLIDELALKFGSQCVVLAVDTNFYDNKWFVYVKGGREITKLLTFDWIKEAENRGAGEILLTSMANDGTKKGFACELTAHIADNIQIPVIASGGAGTKEHFLDVFTKGKAEAALAASIFHFGEIPIPILKQYLKEKGLTIR